MNKLKEYFHIKKSQIPCLVFKDISSQRYKNIIDPVTEDNLYQCFKKLFNDIELLLSELVELINQQIKKRQIALFCIIMGLFWIYTQISFD